MQTQVTEIKPAPKRKIKYEVFNFALCVSCAYFSFENTKETVEWTGKNGCGKCRLIKSMGAYDGVMAIAVCDKFLSHKGTDIKGKSATVRQLPDFVKLIKGEEGRYSVTLTQ
jgi:ABC-type cobalamin/Fe3+-siderophores transport system ATPase subunit